LNNPIVLVALLLLVLVVLVGNTMIAAAFLRSRKGGFKGLVGRDDSALDELHRRVQDLAKKRS
jgi:hypothetical protein